ncbi:MAG: ATP-binding protein, partial [Marinobacterium sp.]
QDDHARQYQVHLRTECPEDLRVYGDVELLNDALSNLVKNAIEFSPPDSAVLIRAEQTDSGIRIEVQDSGPGVPEFAETKLTQRFFCLPKPDGRKGSGLGLSFVDEIMQLHGGTLSYQRDHEQACTRFRLDLPRQ